MTERSSYLLISRGEDRRPAPHASCTLGALAHASRTGFLCAICIFDHFFDERGSGKFLFMLRAK
jgi:hypothetical protein